MLMDKIINMLKVQLEINYNEGKKEQCHARTEYLRNES